MTRDETPRDAAERIAFDLERIADVLLLASTSEIGDKSESNAASYIGEKIEKLAEEQRILVEHVSDERSPE